MKAECIAQYKQLEGILDKGDIVEIEVIKSTKDKIGSWKFVEDPDGAYMRRGLGYQQVLEKDAKGKRFIRIPDVVVPAGNYEEWKFKSKNGHYYTGTGITNRIGNKTLFDIFKKL